MGRKTKVLSNYNKISKNKTKCPSKNISLMKSYQHHNINKRAQMVNKQMIFPTSKNNVLKCINEIKNLFIMFIFRLVDTTFSSSLIGPSVLYSSLPHLEVPWSRTLFPFLNWSHTLLSLNWTHDITLLKESLQCNHFSLY